jgi:hypothetical protein
VVGKIHSAELVDWAQRSLPIKNRLTPNLSPQIRVQAFTISAAILIARPHHLALRGLRPRAFAEAYSGTTAVLVDELDAGDDLKRGPTRLTDSRLKHVHRYYALTDAQQSAMPVP